MATPLIALSDEFGVSCCTRLGLDADHSVDLRAAASVAWSLQHWVPSSNELLIREGRLLSQKDASWRLMRRYGCLVLAVDHSTWILISSYSDLLRISFLSSIQIRATIQNGSRGSSLIIHF